MVFFRKKMTMSPPKRSATNTVRRIEINRKCVGDRIYSYSSRFELSYYYRTSCNLQKYAVSKNAFAGSTDFKDKNYLKATVLLLWYHTTVLLLCHHTTTVVLLLCALLNMF